MAFELKSASFQDGDTLPDLHVKAMGDTSPHLRRSGAPAGHGKHRYGFTVFAVDTDRLDVGPDASGAVFGFNLHFHTLARASITATYENRSEG